MTVIEWTSAVFLVAGAFFFFAGTVGMLRFPDTRSRLHALTKADNLGLGLIVVGIIIQVNSVPLALKLIIIWMLALAASATACQLIANLARSNSRPFPREKADA